MFKVMFKVNNQIQNLIYELEKNGYEAYLVGGCVRDYLMGINPDDTDMTTNATPEQIKEVFRDYRVIETGLKHGTVTVMSQGVPVEITTYRTESVYSDHRHPDSVAFTRSLREDLARRDFTVNAMAYNPASGIKDFFSGYDDIQNKIIRCVGNADERFKEDALRILRALRFSSKLGFEIEKNTSEAIFANKKLLGDISKERISSELNKIICGKNAEKVLYDYAEIIFEVIPPLAAEYGCEQHNPHHDLDIYRHSLKTLSALEPKVTLRLAALLHDIGKPGCAVFDEAGICHFRGHDTAGAKIADGILRELKYDNETREAVVKLISYHMYPIVNTEKSVKKLLSKVGEDTFFDILKHKRADLSGKFCAKDKLFPEIEGAEITARGIIAKGECFSLKDLAVNGNDMLSLGLRGEEIGRALDALLNEVIEGNLNNEKGALLTKAAKMKKDKL